jgi:flagellar assembly factor FliW
MLETKAFGRIEVTTQDIFIFPDGLIGFQGLHEFALLDDGDESPFKWLQSTENSSLAFILMEPELFLNEKYTPAIAHAELEIVKAASLAECLVYAIITIPADNPEKMTANLQGPVLLNISKKIGRQVISNNDDHPVRYSILENLEA